MGVVSIYFFIVLARDVVSLGYSEMSVIVGCMQHER